MSKSANRKARNAAEKRKELVRKYNDNLARYGKEHVKTRYLQRQLTELDNRHHGR